MSPCGSSATTIAGHAPTAGTGWVNGSRLRVWTLAARSGRQAAQECHRRQATLADVEDVPHSCEFVAGDEAGNAKAANVRRDKGERRRVVGRQARLCAG